MKTIREEAKIFLNNLGDMDDEAGFIDGVNFACDKIISLIDEMIGKYKKAENFNGIRREVLTELKNRLESEK